MFSFFFIKTESKIITPTRNVGRWECDPICLSSSYFEYLFVFQLSHAMRTWQLYGFFQIQGYERNNIERGWSITTILLIVVDQISFIALPSLDRSHLIHLFC